MVKTEQGEKNFEDEFIKASKEPVVLMKKDRFDGNQTYINVSQKGNFPFDMDDNIFNLCGAAPKASRYKGLKMKDINIPVTDCSICTTKLQVPKKVAQC